MARALTVARVRVAAAHQEAYLALLGELAALVKQQGRHLWAFRSEADAELFLEFREGPSELRGDGDRAVKELEDRLRRLAPRDDEAGARWLEQPLVGPHP